MKERWQSHPVTGNKLDELLNDKDGEGYDVHSIHHVSTIPVENRLVPGQGTLMPLFTVVFERREPNIKIDA